MPGNKLEFLRTSECRLALLPLPSYTSVLLIVTLPRIHRRESGRAFILISFYYRLRESRSRVVTARRETSRDAKFPTQLRNRSVRRERWEERGRLRIYVQPQFLDIASRPPRSAPFILYIRTHIPLDGTCLPTKHARLIPRDRSEIYSSPHM